MSKTAFNFADGISPVKRAEEARRLMNKWGRTGLLKGLKGIHQANMARLLENQARQVLSEAQSHTPSMQGGTEGFQNVAFPLVRRIYAQLLATEVVSVQPMSLPSGLIFYLDYKFATLADTSRNKLQDYGSYLQGGTSSLAGGQISTTGEMSPPFELGSAYSQYTASALVRVFSTGALGGWEVGAEKTNWRDDSFLTNSGSAFLCENLRYIDIPLANLPANADRSSWQHWIITAYSGAKDCGALGNDMGGTAPIGPGTDAGVVTLRAFTHMPSSGAYGDVGSTIRFVCSGNVQAKDDDNNQPNLGHGSASLEYIIRDTFTAQKVDSVFESNLDSVSSGLDVEPIIPEVNLQIETVAVTAQPRKLKARWTPELAQDLNAYHNLDAEVELTTILGEEIAQEIDNEILLDLLHAAEGTYMEPERISGQHDAASRVLPVTLGVSNIAHWSRLPGKYMDANGATVSSAGNTFTQPLAVSQREWYETLIEKILHVSNTIHKRTLRAAANFIVTSPEVSTILEATLTYKPILTLDEKETNYALGAEKVGNLSNRFSVYKSPYFPINRILVGYRGNAFLETGYVYAPYVPLIVTPTIFAPEDFTPRKGVMTRYAKKVVRPEFYGVVIVHDMSVI